MPGVIPLDDAQQLYADRLQQHAQSVWDTITSAPQAVTGTLQQVAQPAVEAVQQIPTPTLPQVDPTQIIQNLQQHAQDAWQAVQQAPQQVQVAVPQIDPNDITQRLQQHADAAFQAVDQSSQQIGQGLQPAAPAVLPSGQAGVPGVDPRLSGSVQPATKVTNADGTTSIVTPAPRQSSADMPNVQVDSSSPEAFVRSITPAAQWVQQQTGIPAEAIIGMAANETGYGKSAPGNNLFGIKGAGPAGSTTSPTWEDYGNGPVNITDKFRRYDNATQSVQDFVQFLRDNSRYQTVMNLVDSGKATTTSFVQGLKDAGYMTDPNYVGKIQGIVDRYQPVIDQAKTAAGGAVQAGQQAVQGAVETGKQAVSNVLPSVSQFGDKQLTAAEAYAACYDDQTRVLSRRGFVYFRDLTDEDELATRRADGVIEYHRPSARQHYHYRGPMYRFKSEPIDLLVTPNHLMLVTWYTDRWKSGQWHAAEPQLVAAEEMALRGQKWYLPVHAGWLGDRPLTDVPVRCEPEAWAAFVGLFLAEGSAEKTRTNGYPSYRVAVKQAIGGTSVAVRRMFEGLNVPFRESRFLSKTIGWRDVDRFSVSGAAIHTPLAALGKLAAKHVPREMLQASPEVLIALLTGLWLGDGGKMGTSHPEVYTTTSQQLAEDVAELAIKLGFGASIRKNTHRTKAHWNPKYDVTLRWTADYTIELDRHLTVVPEWEGDVYCATVPNHVLLVERNGRINWCGNCGPAAAVRFSQLYGRNPTLREATDLASSVGWTQDTGMAGLQSESKLFDEMNIPHRVVGADWQALQREAQSGNPVTISTPGHYFTADSYDPSTGAFHVGSSGTDLKGGSEWMTAAQMEQRMGPLQGGLAADNPGTPAPSPISAKQTGAPAGPLDQVGQVVQQGAQAIQSGLQQVDNAVQGAVQAGGQVVQGAQQAVQGAAGAAQQGLQDVTSRAQDVIGNAPLPFGAGKVSDVQGVAQGAQELAGRVQTPETDNLPAKVAGTGLSALGTVAREGADTLDRLSIASTAAREAAGEDVYGQKYAAAGGPQLEDEYRQLLAQRMNGDDSVSPRMTEIADQLQQINTTIRAGRPQSEVDQALSAENPLTPVSSTLANVGAMLLAAPLAAGDAPLAARALAELIQPGTNPLQLAQAVRVVNESKATAPAIADVIDQVQKMPGTAQLAPVRQQVQQSSTDLLQAMLDAAKAKGVDPDKLTALEQQVTAMDPTAATRRALAPTAPTTVTAAAATGTGIRGGAELGAVNPRLGTTLGGAVAGGYAGNATTPEDASPLERGARIAGGAALGASAGAALGSAAGYSGSIDQTILESLRNAGLHVGPPRPAAPYRGIIPEIADQTKQMLLTSPTTHIGNVIGNTIELARQPVALAMGGRADDALASIMSVGKALPQAAGNAINTIVRGVEPANLSQGAALIPRRQPIYRALSAADTFTRTLGEYQGMSAKANQLLRDAGMSPGDPGAAAYLATRAADLFQAGVRSGAQSVFGQAGSTATATGGLENIFRVYNNFKEGLLNSPDQKAKAMGALLDFEIPFSGVPVRLLKLVGARTPPGTQVRGAVRVGQALANGDGAAAQQAAGETALESSIQFLIAKNIVDGNIRGADDPDHPNGVHLPGLGWINMSELGGYALPMQVMASFADGYEKGGQNVPAPPGGASFEDYYGPRVNAALNASLKPFVQAVPGMNMIRFLSTALQGDVTGAGTRLAQDAVNRMIVPGAARFVENLTDPVARDVATKGVRSIYEPAFAALPGVAQLLPQKIDPTTGAALGRRVGGVGTLVGQQRDIASPLTIEAGRLNRAGFKDVVAPKTYPTAVTIAGSQVNLKPDEQRQVAQITGAKLGAIAQRLDTPEYQNAPDVRKALMLKTYIAAADKTRTAAVAQVLGRQEFASRIQANKGIAGRLNVQAQAPDDFSFFDPTGENILDQRKRLLAGTSA